MFLKTLLITLFLHIIYVGIGYQLQQLPLRTLLFLSVFFFLGTFILLIIIQFVIFAKRYTVVINSYTKGSGGNAAIGYVGTGRKYTFTYKENSNLKNASLSFPSMFKYQKGNKSTVFKYKDYHVLMNDLGVFTIFAIMFLYAGLKPYLG